MGIATKWVEWWKWTENLDYDDDDDVEDDDNERKKRSDRNSIDKKEDTLKTFLMWLI